MYNAHQSKKRSTSSFEVAHWIRQTIYVFNKEHKTPRCLYMILITADAPSATQRRPANIKRIMKHEADTSAAIHATMKLHPKWKYTYWIVNAQKPTTINQWSYIRFRESVFNTACHLLAKLHKHVRKNMLSEYTINARNTTVLVTTRSVLAQPSCMPISPGCHAKRQKLPEPHSFFLFQVVQTSSFGSGKGRKTEEPTSDLLKVCHDASPQKPSVFIGLPLGVLLVCVLARKMCMRCTNKCNCFFVFFSWRLCS